MYEIDERLLDEARARIARERRRPVLLQLQAPAGVRLSGAEAAVRLTRHAFRFGCNAFGIVGIEDAGLQRAYRERFTALYTLLYSHPAVQAITWWDFSDHHAWMGAPSGLVRADMSPKPLYERLLRLVWGEWATRWRGPVAQGGGVTVPCAAGEHQVEVTLASGARLSGQARIPWQAREPVTVQLA